jgi:hypothetical protein
MILEKSDNSNFAYTLKRTWKAMPASGPCSLIKGSKSLDGTDTTRAALAHFEERFEKDIPLIHSSDSFVLVGTIWKTQESSII